MRLPRGSAGFSLSELMIAMVLSAVVLIAAFHIHSTFQSSLHRQDEIARIQQTMKVTRQLIERRLRSAGAGLNAGSNTFCGGTKRVGPFILHNKNTFGVSDTSAGGVDDDPDWFEVMAADIARSGFLTSSSPIPGVVKKVDNPANFKVGDLLALSNANGVCIFMVTAITGNGDIQYRQGGGPLAACYNDSTNKIACRDTILQTNILSAGSEILNMTGGTFAMRINDSTPARPVLEIASGVAGADPTLYSWQPVAENVEDMQIAVHVDTTTPPDRIGDEWITDRDLTDLELDRVRAVRISLVFRSASEMAGLQTSKRPALEDRPAQTTGDGYVRRVLTSVVKLRNMPGNR